MAVPRCGEGKHQSICSTCRASFARYSYSTPLASGFACADLQSLVHSTGAVVLFHSASNDDSLARLQGIARAREDSRHPILGTTSRL
jgi:hypothetical protein